MATDFMVLPARFLSRCVTTIILAGILSSCGTDNDRTVSKVSTVVIPQVYRQVNDTDFRKQQDTLYYHYHKYYGHVYEMSELGDTILLNGYWEGVEEGEQKKWYSNKQIKEKRYYVQGKKNGLHTGWWDNGNKKFEFTIIDDFNEGNFKEWNRDGLLIKDFNYRHGQEDGSEKLWWNDGTIRANYLVDKGKKYGLIGLKICRNQYDSTK